MKSLDLSKPLLYDLYVNNELTVTEIAFYLHTVHSVILNYLKKYKIKIRSQKKQIKCNCEICNKVIFRVPSSFKKHIYCSKKCVDIGKINQVAEDLVYKLYFEDFLSLLQIAKKLNCHRTTLRNIFKRNNWKCRILSEAQRIRDRGIKIDRKTLYKLYIEQRLSTNQIAKRYNCSSIPIKRLCKKYNISFRPASERAKLCVPRGKNHPHWQNGISKFPYAFEFTKELKHEIRTRDNFICQCCGMTEEEHVEKYGKCLAVHHIDYNKMNCKKDNLITTCIICNFKANYNRDYWFAFYKYKIENVILK